MGIALKIGASYIDMKFYTDESGRECLIDEQFACAEDFYNKNKSIVFGYEFMSESDILEYVRKRCDAYDDDVTRNLYNTYCKCI